MSRIIKAREDFLIYASGPKYKKGDVIPEEEYRDSWRDLVIISEVKDALDVNSDGVVDRKDAEIINQASKDIKWALKKKKN